MKPSEIIQKIDYLNKEITTLIEQLVSNKDNPQMMDIDLLNQKLIGMYDLSLKLRYKLNLGESDISAEETDLEYFHFETGTSRFTIEQEEVSADEEKTEQPVEETPAIKATDPEIIEEAPKVDSIIVEPELVEEIIVEPLEEIIPEQTVADIPEKTETISESEEVVIEEVKEEVIPIEIDIEEEKKARYWTVESGWVDPSIQEKVENQKPVVTEEKKPELKPEPVEMPVKNTVTEVKTEPEAPKPIIESIPKPVKSLNEMMAANKDKTVLAETQKMAFTDFKSAITLNLKISFIRELFQGNEKEYKKMIDFLTRCENFSEAKLYMQGEKEKHPEWEGKQDLLNHLQELINRKFV